MKGNAKGFTLIELVIVIVILGILAAVAVPKFANLQTDAKKSAVKGLGGAVKASANIVRAKWLVSDNASLTSVDHDGIASTDNITVAGTTGYPTDTASGIAKTLDFDTENFDNTTSGDGYIFTYSGTTAPNPDSSGDQGCGVFYNVDDTNDNTTVINIETGGCE